MTAKPPSAPTLSSDTPIKTNIPVIFTEVRDSNNNPVAEGTVTFDKNLKVNGTAKPNTELNLRDRVTTLDDVTSSDSGNWVKQLTLSTFKRYSLTAIEQKPPQNYSSPAKTFVLATETPIFGKVTGNNSVVIESGDTYYGDWVEITGNAIPGDAVEAFDSDTSMGKTTTVDRDGQFKLMLDELSPRTYIIKIKAPSGKESTEFKLIVAVKNSLSLDEVLDDEGNSVDEGQSTIKKTLTIKGKARGNGEITLLGGQPASVTVTAKADGDWEHTFTNLPDGPYSLTARTNYEPEETTAPPRTFKIDATITPHNTRVYDSVGPIADNGSTRYNYVIVRGDAAPSAEIRLKINGVIDPKPEPTDDTGKWVRLVPNLIYGSTYQFKAMAAYGDNAESNPWTINIEALDLKPVIESVKDSYGIPVLPGSTTRDIYLTVSGKATPGQKVRLLNGTDSLREPQANGDGDWVQPITAITEFTSLTAKALYGAGETSSPPYTFTVTPFGEITSIIDSNGNPILEGGYTADKSLTFIGKASPHHTVEVWNGSRRIGGTTADEKGDWRSRYGFSLGLHSITIKVKDTESSPPRTFNVVGGS
jgi:hypothetical protein